MAALFTAVIFCEIFACVVSESGKPALIIIPMLMMPVPLLLLRCCGGGDDFMSSGPKGRHCESCADMNARKHAPADLQPVGLLKMRAHSTQSLLSWRPPPPSPTTQFCIHVEAVRSRLRVPSVLVAGAEFWSAFFFASTLAIPVCFYATGWVPEPGSLVLSLGGVLIAVLSVAAFAACQARAEADSYGAW